MIESKCIVVLANSIRNQQRCVAGKEVARSLFWWKGRRWIRFVDPGTIEGAVRIENTYCKGGGHARVLDVVQVPVTGPSGDPDHPEDWMLQSDCAWNRVDRLSFAELGDLADHPKLLWNEDGQKRWISAGYVRQMEEPSSLYLIADAEDCIVSWWKEPGRGDGEEKVRRRLRLQYRGVEHECDITDPLFTRRHGIFESARSGPPRTIELKAPLFLCLSLTRPWQGKQYKIAASIIESHG